MTDDHEHDHGHEHEHDHGHGHGHDHEHGHGHDGTDETADDPRPRARALQSLLVEKGIVSTDAIDEAISAYERDIGPLNGARIVARAWTDSGFRERLLADANEAIDEFDFEVGVQHIEVKANDDDTHNAVVCTLCSCYPWSLLGLPPTWYKTPAYRSRMVREPRAVLSEFGLDLDDATAVQVWDSSSEIRYMVVPRRPAGTEDYDEDELVDLVTRDSMIGVERLDAPATDGGRRTAESRVATDVFTAAPGDEDGPAFSDPWQARTFGIAVALRDGDALEWSAFQQRLIAEVDDAELDGSPEVSEDAERTYYVQWQSALERLLTDGELLDAREIDARAAQFAAGDRTAEEFVEGDRHH